MLLKNALRKNIHERDLIEILKRASARGGPHAAVRLGMGDDAAILRPSAGADLLLTCDMLVEGVHFDLRTTGPEALGIKAVTASLSDIAAMGGAPTAALVSLGIPRRLGLSPTFFKRMYVGMTARARRFGAMVVGGDTTAAPKSLTVDVFMLGQIRRGRSLRRAGARPGDWVLCTGHPGDSGAGLECLRRGFKEAWTLPLRRRHLMPWPRCREGAYLSGAGGATACIDLSDGLASELHHLATDSAVRLEIWPECIPTSRLAQRLARRLKSDPLAWAWGGGEDYELVFCAPQSRVARIREQLLRRHACPATVIGIVQKGSGVRLRTMGGLRHLENRGYEHKIF